MTGFYTPETEAKILECGARQCLAKPIEPNKLAEVIDGLFSQPGGRGRRSKFL